MNRISRSCFDCVGNDDDKGELKTSCHPFACYVLSYSMVATCVTRFSGNPYQHLLKKQAQNRFDNDN